MQVVKITKGYHRKIVKDYSSVEVSAEITADVKIVTPEDLLEASDKLARQARVAATRDYRAFLQAQQEGNVE